MALGSATLIALSNGKDALGLVGTVLIAVPFFRLERNKRRALHLGRPQTSDQLLREDYKQAGQDPKDGMEQPSAPDFLVTLWGLLLLGLSFLISLILPYLAP